MKLKLTREQATQINQWAKSGFAADDEDITSSELYTKLQNSTEIDASCLNFTREGLLLFANIIATSPSLTSLDVSLNGIRDNAAAFGAAIATSPSLTSLNIYGNDIRDNAAAFGAAIATSPSLTTLFMSHNGIGAHAPDFGAAIARSNLTFLDISYNGIEGADAVAFGAAIARLDSLITLYMRGNGIEANPDDFVKNIVHLPNLVNVDEFYAEKFCQVKLPIILSDLPSISEDIASIVMDYLGNISVDHTDII